MRAQKDFSLIEVLVAILILSMVVLGFLMVQMKSLHQSQSATMRAHAVSAMSAQAELLRDVSDDARDGHERLLNHLNQGAGIDQMNHYQKSILAVSLPCHAKSCSEEMFIRHQGLQIAKAAAVHGIRLNILPCDNQRCLIAAWGETPARIAADGCMNANGSINPGATCMTMVVY